MHRAGFVNIIGKPNVGKSTLLNAFLGHDFSITNPKAQTTRHRIFGILDTDDYQIVFSDTPGALTPKYYLQEAMMDSVRTSLSDADLFLILVEPNNQDFSNSDVFIKIKNSKLPILLLINKIDTSNQKKVEESVDFWKRSIPQAEVIPISALEKFQVDVVLQKIIEHLPEFPPYFPKGTMTDRPERFFVNERIRSKILSQYEQEIPYSVEVQTESFKETKDVISIQSILYTERKSQKAILIGKNGKAIQHLANQAKQSLEGFFNKKIHLDLYVKVRPDWRKKKNELRRFGYLS